MFHAFRARSVIIAAIIEWQKDWAMYMPATELKKIDKVIGHGAEAGVGTTQDPNLEAV
jgi:hypothetical protein